MEPGGVESSREGELASYRKGGGGASEMAEGEWASSRRRATCILVTQKGNRQDRKNTDTNKLTANTKRRMHK